MKNLLHDSQIEEYQLIVTEDNINTTNEQLSNDMRWSHEEIVSFEVIQNKIELLQKMMSKIRISITRRI